jgi:PAS domain S-box-containing protein
MKTLKPFVQPTLTEPQEIEDSRRRRIKRLVQWITASRTARPSSFEHHAPPQLRSNPAVPAGNPAPTPSASITNAFESISEGFALWDTDDRLVLCNSRYRDLYPTISAALMPGAAYDHLLREAVVKRQFRIESRPEDWIRRRLHTHRHRGGACEEHLCDGRWILATEHRTADGGVACIRTDITDRKRAEQVVRQSRATLQSMIDAVAEMIVMVNADGVILAVNRSGAECFGLQPRDLVGHSLIRRFEPEEASRLQRLIHGVLCQKQGKQEEFQWRERWLDLSAHPVMDRHGVPTAVSIFSQDITERKRSEASLRKLTQAVEQSPAIVIITNADGVIEYVNPRFTDVTGFSARDAIGQTYGILDADDPSQATTGNLRTVLGNGQQWRGQVRSTRKDGSSYWASVSISPIKAGDGVITHFVALQEDITERIQAEEDAREHQQQLMRYMRIATLGETTAALAHELNQPITAIINYCNGSLRRLASKNWNPDDLAEALQEAESEARRARDIIRNVSRLVRKTPQEKTTTEVNTMIRSVLDLVRRDLERHQIDIVLELAANLPPVTVNIVEIEQALLNFLRNGIEAIAEVGESPRRLLLRTARAGDDAITVSVHDSGKGFSSDEIEHAFDPFFTTKAEGMGMGLAICRTIIENHGGRIWAESNADGGATIKFTLPVSEVNNAAA